MPPSPNKYNFKHQNPTHPPILLLKTRSSPKDAYEEYFSARGYNPAFVPVLEHRFREESLAYITGLIEGGSFISDNNVHKEDDNHNDREGGGDRKEKKRRAKYGGLIFTSQRAVEAFGAVLERMDQTTLATSFGSPNTTSTNSNPNSDPYPDPNPTPTLPIYTVGPATSRAISVLAKTYLPNTSVHGEHAGTGDVLAGYILEHYNNLHSHSYSHQHNGDISNSNSSDGNSSSSSSTNQPTKRVPPLLFLVGEQRRDVIPKTLMGENTPAEKRVGVQEVVVYETGVMGGFEGDFAEAVEGGSEWLRQSSSSSSSSSSSGISNAGETQKKGAGAADERRRKAKVWVVVFSPTGCDAMVRVLGLLDKEEGKERKKGFYVATIGPTTRDHLWNKYGVRADVCAERPSEEGVYEGIERFMAS